MLKWLFPFTIIMTHCFWPMVLGVDIRLINSFEISDGEPSSEDINTEDYGIEIVNLTISRNSTRKVDSPPQMLQYNELVVRELYEHFAISEPKVISLGSILVRVKELAHNKLRGVRIFGHDSDVNKPKINKNTKASIAPFLFEGDILLNENQANTILAHIQKERLSRSLSSDSDALWRQQPIKFRFHDSLAIRFWEDHTCIRFEHVQEKLPESEDHIEFFKGQGCYSMIGRYGGRQGISIGSGCERTGIVEHEIGHILGLWHEQSRPDAGEYVELQKENILPSYMSDFQLRGTDEIITLGVPYDYGSVMHYGPTAFSTDGISLTLVTKNTLYQSTIGQREKLSFFDIQIINKAYCSDKCTENRHLQDSSSEIDCQNGGYSNPKNCKKCMCPSGYSGDDCSAFEAPKNAQCGGIYNVKFNSWRDIKSPGYNADGYIEDQYCSWIVRAPKDARVEVEFVEEFAFLCSSICIDFVELKLSRDQRATGARFCCDEKPKERLISESKQVAIIFRSQASQDRGFFLRVRATHEPATNGYKLYPADNSITEQTTTTTTTTVLPGRNLWSTWSVWSDCSRSCGACGIRSRIRSCLTVECENKNQEFSACNFETCPVKPDCEKVLFLKRICKQDSALSLCSKLTEQLNECYKPKCCPPFRPVDGKCVTSNDQSILVPDI